MVRRLLDLLGDMQALETSPQSSLRDVLRARTHGAHRSLDDSLAVSDPAVELDDYVAHLEGMWTFHAPLERRLLSSEVLLTCLPDLALRRRAHLAWSDLRALDRDPGKVPFPSCTPDLTSLATQLGVAYVLEGSTLGGAVLARRLGAQESARAGESARRDTPNGCVGIVGAPRATFDARCSPLGLLATERVFRSRRRRRSVLMGCVL